MNAKAIFNIVLMVLCIAVGLFLFYVNLKAPHANIINWLIIGIVFAGAYSCWRKYDQAAD